MKLIIYQCLVGALRLFRRARIPRDLGSGPRAGNLIRAARTVLIARQERA
ncbi:hypothetical protein [Litorivita pollutaquae]|nr:hypothetical protein [Litorivita pollutaquae]